MCLKIRHSRFLKLSMILAACQFSACAYRAPIESPAPKPDICSVKVKEKGVGCVQTLNDFENAYEVKLKDDPTFYSVSNAVNMREEDLLILKSAKENQFPIRLRLKGKEILGIQKLK